MISRWAWNVSLAILNGEVCSLWVHQFVEVHFQVKCALSFSRWAQSCTSFHDTINWYYAVCHKLPRFRRYGWVFIASRDTWKHSIIRSMNYLWLVWTIEVPSKHKQQPNLYHFRWHARSNHESSPMLLLLPITTLRTSWCVETIRIVRRTYVRHKEGIVGCRVMPVSLPAEPWSCGRRWDLRYRPELRHLSQAFVSIPIIVSGSTSGRPLRASMSSTVSLSGKDYSFQYKDCLHKINYSKV